jgi:hypothetical protein
MQSKGAIWFVLALLGCLNPALGQESSGISKHLSWGAGPHQLGRIDPNESDAEGPASFLLEESGEFLVLDQVKSRIARVDRQGVVVESIQLPGSNFMGLDRLPDGRLVVVDRLVRRSVVIVDELLGVVAEYPLEGEQIEDSGVVTAIFVRADGLWLEVSHTYSVRILDLNWQPCPRVTVPGRPSNAGPGSLVARLSAANTLQLALVDGTGATNWSTELTFTEPLERIVWVEDFPDGRTVVVTHIRNGTTGKEELRATRLDRNGEVESLGVVPYTVATWYLQRDVRLSSDGDLVRMWFDESGVHLDDWRLP